MYLKIFNLYGKSKFFNFKLIVLKKLLEQILESFFRVILIFLRKTLR